VTSKKKVVMTESLKRQNEKAFGKKDRQSDFRRHPIRPRGQGHASKRKIKPAALALGQVGAI
jgi:hypothetical protein